MHFTVAGRVLLHPLASIFFSLFVFAFADEPIAKIVQVPTYFDFRGNKLVWELKPISDVILHGPIDMVEGKPRAWFSNVLVVPNKKLIDDKTDGYSLFHPCHCVDAT